MIELLYYLWLAKTYCGGETTSWMPGLCYRGNPKVVFTTGACLSGWGATRNENRTGGLFSVEDKYNCQGETHINSLEAKAVLFVLQALGHDLQDIHGKVYLTILPLLEHSTKWVVLNHET